MIRAASIGVVVSDTTRLIATAAVIVRANSRNNWPTWPPMKISGTNTAIRLKEIDSTVKPTSPAPISAAWNGGTPSSTCRAIFSTTTMASSTTKPVATVSAINERLSSRNPARYMIASVPSSDTTTATAGIVVAFQLRRNRLTTSTTSSVATSSVTSTSLSEARIVVVRSVAICSLMSAGRSACNEGIWAFSASTTATILAPGWRLIRIGTACLPLTSPIVRTSSGPSTTAAMSLSRTTVLLRAAITSEA